MVGSAGFEASALVDGDVDCDAAGSHARNHLPGHQLGCLGAGDQDGADNDIGFGDVSRHKSTVRSNQV